MNKAVNIIVLVCISLVSMANVVVNDKWIAFNINQELKPYQNDSMRILIVELPKQALLPDSHFTVDFYQPFELGANRKVIFLEGDGWRRGIFWRYFCEKWGQYITPKENITSDHIITHAHLQKTQGWIPNETVITDIDEIVGKVAKETLPRGELIFADQIGEAFDVNHSEIVDVVYSRNGIQLTSKGRALERGIIGDTIRVRVNRKTIEATIQGAGMVAIR